MKAFGAMRSKYSAVVRKGDRNTWGRGASWGDDRLSGGMEQVAKP